MRIVAACALSALVTGCATTETVQFRPKAQQQAMIRDGQAALVSRSKSSIVMVRPASRQFQAGGRPIYVVAITNLSSVPINFLMANVEVTQQVKGQALALKVMTFEELATEERNRQIAGAIIGGLAAGANAYSASRAGYYNQSSTVVTPRGGVYQVNTTGYSPTANVIAQSNAAAQNEAMIGSMIERGQQNMAALEQGIIKDNTLMPGEWYGGQLVLQPLNSDSDGPKNYTIALLVGTERHEVDISQISTR
jgi:hypothetical protein